MKFDRRFLIVFSSLIILTFVLYLMFIDVEEAKISTNNLASGLEAAQPTQYADENHVDIKSIETAGSSTITVTQLGEKTQKDAAMGIEDHASQAIRLFSENPQLETWVRERGYLPRDLVQEREYDDALLEAESHAGNIYAQQILAERLVEQKRYIEAESILHEAASRGSTKAIIMIVELTLAAASGFPEQKKESMLQKAEAWLLVSEKRGDPMGKIARQFFSLNPQVLKNDRATIERQSADIYQYLENKRIENGDVAFSETAFPAADLTIFQYLN